MRTFAFYYLLLISMCVCACTQESKELKSKKTVITGVVNNFSDDNSVIIVNYCNPLSNESQFAQNLIESMGHFHTEHEYFFAQNLTIRFANKFINLFVHPGDSVFVTIDANEINSDFSHAVIFSGDNSTLNKELFLWTDYSYPIYSFQFDDKASSEDVLISVKQNFDLAQESIKAYSEKTDMSEFLRKWAYIDHKYITANYVQDYDAKTNKWDFFTNPMFDVFNENNFQTMYFQYHLSVCMNALIEDNPKISVLFKNKEYTLGIQLAIQKLLEKAPEGIVRDVMLFNFLKHRLKEAPYIYDTLPEIKTAFSKKLFNEKLEQMVSEIKTSELSRQLPDSETQLSGIAYLIDDKIENLPDEKLLKYLSEKYKGKVIYIDVWATWCGPCIKAMEFAPDLHDYFKEREAVFVNLCLDSKIENWLQSVKKHNISGENYFLGDNATKLFRAENNLQGYPSYLIIDRSGEIHNPVPGLSNLASAIQKIESCLK